MRLMITFEPFDEAEYENIDKYSIQGFIYSLIENTELFSCLHKQKGFKFFNFSNIFPVSKFKRNNLKKLLISSPNKTFIKEIYNNLKNKTAFYLNKYKMELLKVKILKNKHCDNFQTATPIALFEKNHDNKYYSFNKNPDFKFFFDRMKNNALKKYNAFYKENYYFDDPIFENIKFKKEVSIRLDKNNNKFIVIGSLWDFLKINQNIKNKKFYNFLFDCGLGEKNSLGFGFLNCNWR